jgi:hypothetical protein
MSGRLANATKPGGLVGLGNEQLGMRINARGED